LERQLDKVVKFAVEREVPVFCGEFGVFIPNSLPEDRVRWYEIIKILFDLRGIIRTSWDYFGGFGIFNTDRGGSFESDLNIAVVNAMGFTAPEQKPAEKIRENFTLFDNFPAAGIAGLNYWNCELDMYHPNGDKYVLAWSNPNQYGAFNFDFRRDADWKYLLSQDYAVTFKVKANSPARFDVRFINREDAENMPWRIFASVDAAADGNWHNVRIPFSSMREHGAWVNATQAWHTPQEKFSWENIVTLAFVAEDNALPGVTLLFDAIKIEK
jgi:endoglucanase